MLLSQIEACLLIPKFRSWTVFFDYDGTPITPDVLISYVSLLRRHRE